MGLSTSNRYGHDYYMYIQEFSIAIHIINNIIKNYKNKYICKYK